MDNRQVFEIEMVNFFKNWKYTKGQFEPFDESLSYIDIGINEVLTKFKNQILYDSVNVWGETLIYTFIWPDENTSIQINITPRGEKSNVFFRYGINWKPLPNED